MNKENKKPNLDDLFNDLSHPNPNVNYKASLQMDKYWPDSSLERLILNLDISDLELRRKSVRAISSFGERVVEPLITLFLSSENDTLKLSCLKVFVRIANYNPQYIFPEGINAVVKLSLENNLPQINLTAVSLLKMLREEGKNSLIQLLKSENLLIAKASIMALGELEDPEAESSLRELLNSSHSNEFIVESIRLAINECI